MKMKRLYFGLVPKEVNSETMLEFFKKYDSELENFVYNEKLLSYNFGFFDTHNFEKILRQNGLQTLGFMLRVRPVKRTAFAYTEEEREYCYNDCLVMNELAYEEKCRTDAEERRQKALKSFIALESYGDRDSSSENSESTPFSQIAPRPSAKEFCGVRKSRRALLPLKSRSE